MPIVFSGKTFESDDIIESTIALLMNKYNDLKKIEFSEKYYTPEIVNILANTDFINTICTTLSAYASVYLYYNYEKDVEVGIAFKYNYVDVRGISGYSGRSGFSGGSGWSGSSGGSGWTGSIDAYNARNTIQKDFKETWKSFYNLYIHQSGYIGTGYIDYECLRILTINKKLIFEKNDMVEESLRKIIMTCQKTSSENNEGMSRW